MLSPPPPHPAAGHHTSLSPPLHKPATHDAHPRSLASSKPTPQDASARGKGRSWHQGRRSSIWGTPADGEAGGE